MREGKKQNKVFWFVEEAAMESERETPQTSEEL